MASELSPAILGDMDYICVNPGGDTFWGKGIIPYNCIGFNKIFPNHQSQFQVTG